jgi:Family of unknown function (DUF5397)
MSDAIVQERPSLRDLVGTFRRFGPYGTAYEVLEIHDERATIRVVGSGETLEYPLEKLLADPIA